MSDIEPIYMHFREFFEWYPKFIGGVVKTSFCVRFAERRFRMELLNEALQFRFVFLKIERKEVKGRASTRQFFGIIVIVMALSLRSGDFSK